MFTRGIIVDLIKLNKETDLVLVDTDKDTLTFIEGLSKKIIFSRKAPIHLTATTDRRTVLKGATVVLCTIGVGGRRAWEQDVLIPRKYGIYQPVGDTASVGGSSRALRMVPAMVDIAKDVLDLCPQALFINYGNPMAVTCRAVHKATGANMYGLCIGVHETISYLASALNISPESMKFSFAGINHLTWITDARENGADVMPKLKQLALRKMELLKTNPEFVGINFTDAVEFNPASKVKLFDDISPLSWELLIQFGAFPAPMDRHVTEFFPQLFVSNNGMYYGKKLGIDAYSFENTIAFGDRIYAEMREIALSPDPLPADYFEKLGGEQELAVDIIQSIRNDLDKIYSANLPNTGQVPNLPMGCIIESPAIADSNGLHAIMQKPLPPGIAGTLATRMQWVETIVDAALEGSKEKFVQALIIDGSVTSIETSQKLANELLAEHAAYLPQFQNKG